MPLISLVPVLMMSLAFLATLLACIFAPQLPAALRGLLALGLVPVILFCCFGFMATFEPLEPAVQTTWRVIYSAIAVSSIAAIARLALAKKPTKL